MEQEHLRVKLYDISVIKFAKNHTFHDRSKHNDVRYHFVHNILEEDNISVEKMDTKDNLAGMLRKVFSGLKLQRYKDLIHIVSC